MYRFEATLRVQYYETDQMAVVHHSNYIRYFECARSLMMEAWGYPLSQCEKDGVMIPIISVECRYRRPARFGDTLTVTAEIDAVPQARLPIVQKVYNQSGELCAEGKVVLGFIDARTFRPVRCPEKLSRIIENCLL